MPVIEVWLISFPSCPPPSLGQSHFLTLPSLKRGLFPTWFTSSQGIGNSNSQFNGARRELSFTARFTNIQLSEDLHSAEPPSDNGSRHKPNENSPGACPLPGVVAWRWRYKCSQWIETETSVVTSTLRFSGEIPQREPQEENH
ncbi:hypothetical protein DL96DRAFT_1549471 [Flagelloscypha sp. PMI_526]|nr:hypothetical protein DL96DRAFT_1549471 [Flagelloscypha sp. PMI_526]